MSNIEFPQSKLCGRLKLCRAACYIQGWSSYWNTSDHLPSFPPEYHWSYEGEGSPRPAGRGRSCSCMQRLILNLIERAPCIGWLTSGSCVCVVRVTRRANSGLHPPAAVCGEVQAASIGIRPGQLSGPDRAAPTRLSSILLKFSLDQELPLSD
jgi:hypothetical protein